MPGTVTLNRERRSPLRAPWVYRSLSISLSIFRIIIQVTVPNFAGYMRSSPAP
ncbi:rCG56954, isoform CRA_a [Rattus norvegicus]|uniref:RCG56954, isoform CRA_a n=2 Tax=Rattus norvegicus TaxID=10116 RepID=A6JCT1_RAT|nr:rCG56954, isoform CRA_a [Rattus norvegicus]EDL89854.1 rCG56954, isoform CRA_a [Rattus norvegicus]